MPDDDRLETQDLSTIRVGGRKNGSGVKAGGWLIPTSLITGLLQGLGLVALAVLVFIGLREWKGKPINVDTLNIETGPLVEALGTLNSSLVESTDRQTQLLETNGELMVEMLERLESVQRMSEAELRSLDRVERQVQEHRLKSGE